MSTWQSMGSSERPTREQTEALRRAARATEVTGGAADAEGNFVWESELTPWSLALVTGL